MWAGWPYSEKLPACKGAVKLTASATESNVVVEENQGNQADRPSIVGECPGVDILVAGVKLPCLLDTGSQVTLFSETFFQKWLSGEQKRNPQDLHWLTLKAANGLKIPYTGYAILDFSVGGVTVPGKGVIIVKDECLKAERGCSRRTEPVMKLPVEPSAMFCQEASALLQQAQEARRFVFGRSPVPLAAAGVGVGHQPLKLYTLGNPLRT
ncbi:hypothetical protein JOQ06_012411 [Pogonophryne albipinna]|uniref:Retropepsins domain-containing protein n=1 Tax=Pogonophryne albipinna TaxID=1090488 RepID=A0AAD6BGU9_9TELE|nr:hypothetical protein JOQ06_012411 [Pogonophryne albipinna]